MLHAAPPAATTLDSPIDAVDPVSVVSTVGVLKPTSAPLRAPRVPHSKTLLPVDSAESRAASKGASSDPEYYKNAMGFSAATNHDLEDIYKQWDTLIPVDDAPLIEEYVKELLAGWTAGRIKAPRDVDKAMKLLQRSFKGRRRPDGSAQNPPRKSEIIAGYISMVARGEAEEHPDFQRLLVKKAAKSLSGVLVVTVLTSPFPHGQKFSCEWNCYYCPNEPGQPRSYLHDEPSVRTLHTGARGISSSWHWHK